MPRGTQIINDREYVYECKSIWDSDKQRSKQIRNYIGHIENGEFVPNKKFSLQAALKEAKRGNTNRPIHLEGCSRVFAGATRLFDAIGDKIGIIQDLRVCFPEDCDELLSIAYFLILEPQSPLYRFKKWSATHEHPAGHDIPSQRSSELLGRITEEPVLRCAFPLCQ